MNYKSEKEFLKDYNPNDFDRLSMTADILLISVSNKETINTRKNDEKVMSILLVKRQDYPYKNKYCLPGGFLNPKNEILEDCAKRVLKSETNLEDIYLEQLYTFDSLDRDPRTRVISTSFVALIDKNKLTNMINPNAKWFDIESITEENNLVTIKLINESDKIILKIKKELKEKTTDRYKYIGIDNKDIAFDHDIVILSGLNRIRNKLNYTDIVFNMMPEYFTLKELQKVYEVILGKNLLDPAFRRMIKDKVDKTDKMETGIGHRPSVLYKYKNNF